MGGSSANEQSGAAKAARDDANGSKNQAFLFGVYHHPNVTAAAKTIRMDPEKFAVSSDHEIEKFVHHVKYAPTRRKRLPIFEEITKGENASSKQ